MESSISPKRLAPGIDLRYPFYRELISGPNPATGARLLSFNWTQSGVVIGLVTGRNTSRRRLYTRTYNGANNPIRRKCRTEEETSVPHFVWVWGLDLTQTYISGFLLFGPGGH